MIWDNIPDEIKENGLWCAWKLTEKGKIPFDVQTGKMAKANDKTTFAPFGIVMSKLSRYYKFDENGKNIGGLGLGIFNGFSAIDIDHCVDEKGKLNDIAKDVVDYCQSYTEISPSGTGVRIIFKTDTKLDKNNYYINNHRIGLEIYISEQTNKYVTITGNTLIPSKVNRIDISYILNKFMMKENSVAVNKFDIEKYSHDTKLNELWNSEAPGSNSNESELDLALCSKLAFYLHSDFYAINKAFMESPFYKSKDPKHIKKWGRQDYKEETIRKSVSNLSKEVSTFDEWSLTDTGNAHLFAKKYGDQIRYNTDNQFWMMYNGKYWQPDVYNNIKNYAELVIEEMKMSAKINDNEDMRKAMMKNVKRSLQSGGKQALIKETEHLEGIPVMNSNFNYDGYLFNCESGVIDLKRKKILPHNKDLMLSRFSPFEVKYNKPKQWLKFLNEIFDDDKEVIAYIQRVFGYAMTGSTSEQCMFMLIGDGSNGKSLLLDILNIALGSYGETSNVDILLEQRNQSGGNLGDVARLNGMRCVTTDEAKLNDKLNESAIKTMTSGIGNIVARFLYGKEFTFTPKMKIFMASNYKPTIRGTDHGIWRRIKIIYFDKVIPDDEQDKGLKDKLLKEMPDIIGWIVKGCIDWQKKGLREPKKFKNAQKDYRSEMDVVQRWIDEVCILNGDVKEKSSVLFENFSNYVKANKEFQLSHTMFGRNMGKKFTKRIFAGTVYYLGVKLKEGNDYVLTKEEIEKI